MTAATPIDQEERFRAAIAAFVPGEVVDGKYRVDGFLGAGAMAAVFRATDVLLERPVALKVLYAGDPELLRAEAKALARVRHDNIVQVYSFGVHAKLWFIVMELIEGANLEDTIAREGRVPPAAAIGILEKIAAALDAAHAASVLHRDVKPANVLIGPSYRVCVSDFGLAGVADTISGTPTYMAPESFDGAVTARGDQYALAVTAYEMLTGRPPFEHDDLDELVHRHRAEVPPPLGIADVPAGMESAIARGLAKDPAARFDSCSALVTALRSAWSAGLTSPSRTGPKVLIVDDDLAIRRLFSALIADAFPNARVATASDGLVALELMRASAPDLVTLDLQMPNLNGTELLHRLRGEPNLNPRVIAISGLLGRERPVRGGIHVGVMLRALGVAEQLAKPIDPRVFVDAVRRQLSYPSE